MQMISLMDSLLKRVNLDLRCTTAVTLLLLGVPDVLLCTPLRRVLAQHVDSRNRKNRSITPSRRCVSGGCSRLFAAGSPSTSISSVGIY